MNGFQDPEKFEHDVITEFQKSAPNLAAEIKIHSVPIEVIEALAAKDVIFNVAEINCVEDKDLIEM